MVENEITDGTTEPTTPKPSTPPPTTPVPETPSTPAPETPSAPVPETPPTPETTPTPPMPEIPPTTPLPPATPPTDENEIKPLLKRKTLSIVIHDPNVLRAAYMQFMKSGGLFIPTKKAFAMGEVANLVIRLLDEEEAYRVAGKVVWITPSDSPNNKAGGIGVEFSDDKNGERLRNRIEVILGPHLKSTESTHTM